MALNPGRTNLISWWSLDEASGTRFDKHGSNNLADNFTVTQTTGVVNDCAVFTRVNTEFLSIADNAPLSTGNIDFTVGGWIYLTSKPAGVVDFASKSTPGNANQDEYFCRWLNTTDRFQLIIGGQAAADWDTVNASTFGAPSLATWYFFIGQHDAAGTTIKISINAGALDTTGGTTPPNDTAGGFTLGSNPLPDRYLDGRMDEWFFYKKLLAQSEIDWLYNGGSGRAYEELSPIRSRPIFWNKRKSGLFEPKRKIFLPPRKVQLPGLATI